MQQTHAGLAEQRLLLDKQADNYNCPAQLEMLSGCASSAVLCRTWWPTLAARCWQSITGLLLRVCAKHAAAQPKQAKNS
jgi:hypothetical protein